MLFRVPYVGKYVLDNARLGNIGVDLPIEG